MNEFSIKIDVYHALEDFLDVYDNHAEMVVTETIANAMDVNASKITITMKENLDDKKIISFHNNGPSMNKKQFENYHILARSSKTKGKGIGFAGIGAKVYLVAWPKTVIHTETTDGNIAFGSNMYVRDDTLKAAYVDCKLKKPGTLYEISLKTEDYRYLEKNLTRLIVRVFNPAIMDGLAITVNGKKIRAWEPACDLKNKLTVNVKNKKFQALIRVTKDEVPVENMYIQYHVTGKVITTKTPDWVNDVLPDYKKRIHVYVDALQISDKLNLNKTNFKFTHSLSPLFKEIDRHVFDLLKKKKLVVEQSVEKWERTRLTKFFEKLFKDPKYAFLNPNARGGAGPGQGHGTEGIGAGERHGKNYDQQSETNSNDRSGKKRAGGGAFSMGFVERPHDKRDGWLDPSTNKIMINIDHPLFIKYERNMSARNQRIGSILTSVLIKNATSKKPMSPDKAFDLQSELLTMAKDVMW